MSGYRLYLSLLLLLYAPLSAAEFDYRSYQPSTYDLIKTRHKDDLLNASQENDYVVSAVSLKYVLPVTFIKDLRKISPPNMAVIRAWQKSLRVPEGFIRLYQHEFRVEFSGETYWIPVQEELLLPMSSELHPGDRFELYVVLIGARNNKLVFLATEFKSDRAPE